MMVSRHTLFDAVYNIPNPEIEIDFQIALKIGFCIFPNSEGRSKRK